MIAGWDESQSGKGKRSMGQFDMIRGMFGYWLRVLLLLFCFMFAGYVLCRVFGIIPREFYFQEWKYLAQVMQREATFVTWVLVGLGLVSGGISVAWWWVDTTRKGREAQ